MVYHTEVWMEDEVIAFDSNSHDYATHMDHWFTFQTLTGDFYHFDSRRIKYVVHHKTKD